LAITGRSLADAARRFTDHLNNVLAHTLTQAPLILSVFENRSEAQISFRRDGAPVGVQLNSHFGPLLLWVGQTCGAFEDKDGSARLYTSRYRYTITMGTATDALLRWEYDKVRPVATARWCRHHLQGQIDLHVGGDIVALNDWHLPTGYVPLEEIIRFCIVDMGVTPATSGWDESLNDSYRRFKTEFTSA
jgi:hypothetical protein